MPNSAKWSVCLALTALGLISLSPGFLRVNSQTSQLQGPVGIVDAGIGRVGNSLETYSYNTTGVEGFIQIYGGEFYTAPAGTPEQYPSGPRDLQVTLSSFLYSGGQYLWVYAFWAITDLGGNRYNLSIWDFVFNVTGGSFDNMSRYSVLSGQGLLFSNFYGYASYVSALNSPFWLGVRETVNSSNPASHPVLSFYYFTNSSGWVKYDEVELNLTDPDSRFVIQGYNPQFPTNQLDLEWVIGGFLGESFSSPQAYVNSWRAHMYLFYYSSGQWHVPPFARSYSTWLVETVNGEEGIVESWNNTGEYANQVQGVPNFTQLWTPSASVGESTNGTLTFQVTPAGGMWIAEVKDLTSGTTSKVNLVAGGKGYFLVPGHQYNVTLTLYGGETPVFSKSFILKGQVEVSVKSNAAFTLNGARYGPGTYSFALTPPVNLTFPSPVYLNSTSRLLLKSVVVNGQRENYSVLILTSSADVVAVYTLQYYVNFSTAVNGTVNGLPQHITSGWFDNGSSVRIPTQFVYLGNDTREVVEGVNLVILHPSSVSLRSQLQYLLSITLPNGTSRGWFNASSQLPLPQVIYQNSDARWVLSGNYTASSPGTLRPSYTLQYYVSITLPNSTETGWFNAGSTVSLPEFVYQGNSTRFTLNQTRSLIVESPLSLTPRYVKQYLITLVTPNSTLTGWYNAGFLLRLPQYLYINSSARYSLHGLGLALVDHYGIYRPNYTLQYLVRIYLPNGTETLWADNGSIVQLPRVVSLTQGVRFVSTGELSYRVTGPAAVRPTYVEEFQVDINGQTQWVPKGAEIRLYQQVPFYETARWQGTVSAANGQTVTVESPLTEAISISPNYGLIGVVLVVGVVAGAVVWGLLIRGRQ